MDTTFFAPLTDEQFTILIIVAAVVGAAVGVVRAWRSQGSTKRQDENSRH